MRRNKHKKRVYLYKSAYRPKDVHVGNYYDIAKAISAFRKFCNRGAKYGESKNSRWQIYNRINYGRY